MSNQLATSLQMLESSPEGTKTPTLFPAHNPISLTTQILGGYVLWPRNLPEIAHSAPVVREAYSLINRKCNHKDDPSTGLKRGQCRMTLADIAEELHWFIGYRKKTYSKTQCEGALEHLRKLGMITTAKTTRGLIITVCKYDYYNTPANYENNSEGNKKTTRRQQPRSTIYKNDKNLKNDKNIEVNIAFEKFWDAYDKKVGKLEKLRAMWARLTDTDRQSILDYLPKYKEAQPDKQYRKNPEAFLNNRTWEDELIVSPNRNQAYVFNQQHTPKPEARPAIGREIIFDEL